VLPAVVSTGLCGKQQTRQTAACAVRQLLWGSARAWTPSCAPIGLSRLDTPAKCQLRNMTGQQCRTVISK
jgi:hypothetical protein